MVSEMAGSYDLLVPLMLSEAVAFVLLRRVALYSSQLPSRLDSPAHHEDARADVLASIRVGDAFQRGARLAEVRPGAHLEEVMRVLASTVHPAVLVRDGGRTVGIVPLATLQGTLYGAGLDALLVAADLMSAPSTLCPDDDLHASLNRLLHAGSGVLPVVDGQSGDAIGVLTIADITRAYEDALAARASSASLTPRP
jgi:CIC family chloride channel protein